MAILLLTTVLLFTNCQRKNTQISSVGTSTSLNRQVQAGNGTPMLLGNINRAGLEKAPFGEWFKTGYQQYTTDAATLAPIKEELKKTEVLVFMGTWCGDSKREVPHFYKILDDVGYPEKQLQVVAVDRDKKQPEQAVQTWKIEYVPTIILLQNGKEIGRIVENPMETLEKDLAGMLKK